MERFQGKVAFVTGASRGLGKCIASAFAREGAKVCLADIDEERLSQTEAELRSAGYEVRKFVVDVTNRAQVDQAAEQANRHYGKLDILVNNAGVLRDNLLFRMSDDDWDTVMNVHLKGTFLCARAVQQYMVHNRYGRIINLSSTAALGNRGQANYSAAKAGLQGLTKTLAIELGKFGITVNAVAPGFIESDMTRATAMRQGIEFEPLARMKAEQIPVGRIGQPEDIANAVLFFAMEQSSFINGQVLYAAGGPKS